MRVGLCHNKASSLHTLLQLLPTEMLRVTPSWLIVAADDDVYARSLHANACNFHLLPIASGSAKAGAVAAGAAGAAKASKSKKEEDKEGAEDAAAQESEDENDETERTGESRFRNVVWIRQGFFFSLHPYLLKRNCRAAGN